MKNPDRVIIYCIRAFHREGGGTSFVSHSLDECKQKAKDFSEKFAKSYIAFSLPFEAQVSIDTSLPLEFRNQLSFTNSDSSK